MVKRFLLFLLLISCLTLIHCTMSDSSFDWQGHRGCRGILPENSIPGFLKALEYPIKTLELDVVISKDKKVIISHEPFFSHEICKKPDGTPVVKEEEEQLRIYELTYEEIKAFDCGSRGNQRFPEQQPMVVNKPSLEDMVNAVNVYCEHNNREKPFYNIEIKSRPEWYDVATPSPEAFAALLLNELEELEILSKTSIQSFDTKVLNALNRQNPNAATVFLVENMEGFEANLEKVDFVPTIYSPYYKYVTAELVQKVHDKKMQLVPWTVNEVADMENLINLGVDGIITDYPNRISEVKLPTQ